MSGLDFLKMYASTKTVKAYQLAIKKYIGSVYKIEIKNGDLEKYVNQYLAENRDHQKDIEEFLVSIKDSPPKSIKLYLAGAKTFLLENKIELPQMFWRRLTRRIKGTRALTLDKVPSNLELRKIIQHLPIQGKALFLFLSSTGMRIGEALQIKIEDIDLNTNKISMRGEYTKTGNSRISFFSTETKEALEDWLKNRDRYLEQAVGRSAKNKKTLKDKEGKEDRRLFPYLEPTLYSMWNNALSKAGLLEKDASTNWNKSHPHVLRKFFRTRLGSVIPVDVVEALMGHEGYLTEVYRKYSVEDLADFYKKGESALFVFSNGAEVTKLKVEVEEKNKQLQTIINGLVSKNLELKKRLEQIEGRDKEIQDEIETIKKIIEKLR